MSPPLAAPPTCRRAALLLVPPIALRRPRRHRLRGRQPQPRPLLVHLCIKGFELLVQFLRAADTCGEAALEGAWGWRVGRLDAGTGRGNGLTGACQSLRAPCRGGRMCTTAHCLALACGALPERGLYRTAARAHSAGLD